MFFILNMCSVQKSYKENLSFDINYPSVYLLVRVLPRALRFIISNWFMQLRKLRSLTIFHLHTKNPEKLVVSESKCLRMRGDNGVNPS